MTDTEPTAPDPADIEQLVVRRLERRADAVPVGPAPVDALVRAADVRRRRPLVAVLAAAAVAVVAIGVAAIPWVEEAPRRPVDPAPGADTTASTASLTPPPGTRWVGYGRVVVPVPETWGTDAVHCLTPVRDTVVVDPPAHRCAVERPTGVESVQVLAGARRFDRFPTLDLRLEEMALNGVTATRTPVVCRPAGLCAASVEVPSEEVQVVIESSTGEREVEQLVAAVRVLPEPPTKRVGTGHLSVEVPAHWAHDALDVCGTPTADTAVTRTASRSCFSRRAPGIEAVHAVTTPPTTTEARSVDLDGTAAVRGVTVCEARAGGLCQAALWLPEEGVGLVVTSTTDADAVDAVLDTASFDDGLVAVPAPHRPNGVPYRVASYEEVLRRAGLTLSAPPDQADREVVTVDPAPGAAVPVGTTVHVTTAGP